METDCRYGDQATWCGSITAADCYANEASCCKTCYDYNSGSPGTHITCYVILYCLLAVTCNSLLHNNRMKARFDITCSSPKTITYSEEMLLFIN